MGWNCATALIRICHSLEKRDVKGLLIFAALRMGVRGVAAGGRNKLSGVLRDMKNAKIGGTVAGIVLSTQTASPAQTRSAARKNLLMVFRRRLAAARAGWACR